jgi:hypothetical protein
MHLRGWFYFYVTMGFNIYFTFISGKGRGDHVDSAETRAKSTAWSSENTTPQAASKPKL